MLPNRPARAAALTTGCAALVGALVIGLTAGANAAVSVTEVPYRMDASNQAGWWKPIEEYNGSVYLAYNAWGSASAGGSADTHTVYIARRAPNGTWSRGCMQDSSGGCFVFGDDIGHNQPTIAIDGDGYIHAFVSMHGHTWRYYRSASPGAVEAMINRNSQMPNPTGSITYPVAARAANGDVYVIVCDRTLGKMYRWNNTTNVWSYVATFASEGNRSVYPDDVAGTADGSVHIAWEWARGAAGGLRHVGSYLRYSPATNRFHNAAGTAVTVPVTSTSPVAYQPLEGSESFEQGDMLHDPGVQSAKLAVAADGRPMVAYRYRATPGGTFRVRLAEWTGTAWQRSWVYTGAYDTFAAVDVSTYGGGVRVYYAKNQTIANDHAFAATRQANGTWAETLLLNDVPVERLAVIRRGATDHLYLASPGTHQLFYGSLPW
jgi:hypothetical protein